MFHKGYAGIVTILAKKPAMDLEGNPSDGCIIAYTCWNDWTKEERGWICWVDKRIFPCNQIFVGQQYVLIDECQVAISMSPIEKVVTVFGKRRRAEPGGYEIHVEYQHDSEAGREPNIFWLNESLYPYNSIIIGQQYKLDTDFWSVLSISPIVESESEEVT